MTMTMTTMTMKHLYADTITMQQASQMMPEIEAGSLEFTLQGQKGATQILLSARDRCMQDNPEPSLRITPENHPASEPIKFDAAILAKLCPDFIIGARMDVSERYDNAIRPVFQLDEDAINYISAPQRALFEHLPDPANPTRFAWVSKYGYSPITKEEDALATVHWHGPLKQTCMVQQKSFRATFQSDGYAGRLFPIYIKASEQSLPDACEMFEEQRIEKVYLRGPWHGHRFGSYVEHSAFYKTPKAKQHPSMFFGIAFHEDVVKAAVMKYLPDWSLEQFVSKQYTKWPDGREFSFLKLHEPEWCHKNLLHSKRFWRRMSKDSLAVVNDFGLNVDNLVQER